MKITETTQPAPPPPRTFTLEVTGAELTLIRYLTGKASWREDDAAGVPEGTGAGIYESAAKHVGYNF